mmetsp:Transcript_15169/g.22202  ORF Transcript_15169/g.22202 Transcript_15169/m.22202 type:complete len:247 (-) Transcript_15169:25-765(-)
MFKLGITVHCVTILMTMQSCNSLAPQKIFCFGDSLTAGTSPDFQEEFPYGPHLEKALQKDPAFGSSSSPPPLVRWRGLPGWTSSNLVSNGGLSAILDKINSGSGSVDLLILLAGTNDLGYESDCDVIFKSITSLHEIAHSQGVRTVALGIPTSAWQAQCESAKTLASAVNSKLEAWADGDERGKNQGKLATFVPFPIREYARDSGLWSSDGLHFSKKGYEFIGECLSKPVAGILAERKVKSETGQQ